MLRALADLHDATGWAVGDTGLRDLARHQFAHGLRYAKKAGDQAWLLVNLYGEGRMELHYGQPNAALKLFQLGLIAAQDHGSVLAESLFEANCAWALARLGLADEALLALRRAREFHQASGPDEPACLRFFAQSHLLRVSGSTLLALGRWKPLLRN